MNVVQTIDLILVAHQFCRYVEHVLKCEICGIHNGILIVLENLPMNVAACIVTAINIHQIVECSSPESATLDIPFCLFRT